MCGIAGVIGAVTEQTVTRKMLDTMMRRGPDGNGIYQMNDCCLLHSRLAIIDPIGGKQPMDCSWGGEEYVLVYNGELYNTVELRSELILLGHVFQTNSDTEVVLHGYIQWKEKCLDKFNGIFSFAVWHCSERILFLGRDRIGVKPLFYTQLGSIFCFASEIKTLLAYPGVKPQLDSQGIAQLMLLGPGRIPGDGVFRGIRELRPGCYGIYHDGTWRWTQYWRLTDRPHTDTFEETLEKVRYLVSDAIKRQMVSDVPVGTFLSGGLDSSIISAVCADVFAGEGKRLSTFSVGYRNNEKYFQPGKFQPDSDDQFIRIMEQFIGSKHRTTILSPEDLANHIDCATIARDLPGMADVDFSLCAFCGHIVNEVKVALSGECADEIFGGYPWYRDPDVRAQEGFPWAQNTAYRASFIKPDYFAQLNPSEFVMDHYRTTIHQSDILPGTNRLDRRMKEMVNLNFDWFMQTLLDRKDRMSMYNSLEVRVPFCDYRIAEYLYSVPWKYKDYQSREKGLLRYAVKDLLPDQIIYRKKSPYPKTFDPQYTAIVSSMLKDVLSDSSSPILSIVNKDAIEKLLCTELEWPWYGQLMKGPQTIAYMLQINRWMELYKVEIV